MILTFVGANMQALLWQSSDWLVSTVLPAVVVDLTNDERSDLAAPPLRRSVTLDEAARQKAQHMSANQYFAHFAPDGTSPWDFFAQAGYVYAHAGENLAIHFTDSAQVVDAWMDSPAHRENIANGTFTEIGVGTARGSFDGYDTVFVVQLFGTPAAGTQPAVPPITSDAVPTAAPENPELQASESTQPTLTQLRAELELLEQQANTLAQTPPVTLVDRSETETSEPPEPTQAVLATAPIEQPQPVTLPAATPQPVDVLVFETQLATSSGLVAASQLETVAFSYNTPHAGATIAAAATRPNLVLDVTYSLLLSSILVLLCVALFGEARRLHYLQVAYSLLLIAGVGGLWFTHTLLTSGAVIT